MLLRSLTYLLGINPGRFTDKFIITLFLHWPILLFMPAMRYILGAVSYLDKLFLCKSVGGSLSLRCAHSCRQ